MNKRLKLSQDNSTGCMYCQGFSYLHAAPDTVLFAIDGPVLTVYANGGTEEIGFTNINFCPVCGGKLSLTAEQAKKILSKVRGE